MSTNGPKPMTNAERQRAFRARKAAQAATEVRGLFAHPDDHQAVKDYAAKLASKRAKAARAVGPNAQDHRQPAVNRARCTDRAGLSGASIS